MTALAMDPLDASTKAFWAGRVVEAIERGSSKAQDAIALEEGRNLLRLIVSGSFLGAAAPTGIASPTMESLAIYDSAQTVVRRTEGHRQAREVFETFELQLQDMVDGKSIDPAPLARFFAALADVLTDLSRNSLYPPTDR